MNSGSLSWLACSLARFGDRTVGSTALRFRRGALRRACRPRRCRNDGRLAGFLHIDRALESGPVLESHTRSNEIALDVARSVDDDLLFTEQIASHMALDPDTARMDIGPHLSCPADRHPLSADDDFAIDMALNDEVLFTHDFATDLDRRSDQSSFG